MTTLSFRLVDVFAAQPLSGNGLTVLVTEDPLPSELMQRLTVELRQFETIFLTPTEKPGRFRARVFTMEEELDFAGHPVIGAAAVLHEIYAPGEASMSWNIDLNQQTVEVESRWQENHVAVTMRQETPLFLGRVDSSSEAEFLGAFGLDPEDRAQGLPMEVVTTGLPYLILPVTARGLTKAGIRTADLEERLARFGAKFAYVFDAHGREGRTWDNAGRVEDIATGSAAGPAVGYLVRHGMAEAGDEVILSQGRFAGRPSEMRLKMPAHGLFLSGEVRMIARGGFDSSVVG